MSHPSVIAWQDPPSKGFGRERVDWEPVLHALRSNPGQYGLIGQYPSKTAAASAAQTLTKRHPGWKFRSASGLEVEQRGNGSELYGMFIGHGVETRAA